eukprot:TRINITY_DN65_c0_g2_i6.p1 TRINITY_DN65_c0_g2~~TRINITY_DN65_c0_g2_i6.p1  ORF type:complete len:747 (+),score=42.30 TRINITY_DN65_c0_g2_i6:1473-3713(+)
MSAGIYLWSRFVIWAKIISQSMHTSLSLHMIMGIAAVLPYTTLIATGDLVFADSPYSDYVSFQVPMREFVTEELSEGRFPHWIPWVGCGIPMHATQQTGICYPLLTPLLLILNANLAIKTSLLLHVLMCYVGQYQLARLLAISREGSAIAGVIATQSGFLTCHMAVGHVALVLAFGLLPWLMLAVVVLCRKSSWLATAGFAATVAGLLLVGHPQVPYYCLVGGGLWVAGSLVKGKASQHRVRVICQFSIGLMIGVLLASIQLLPTMELMQDNAGLSRRGTAEYASGYSLDWIDLYRLLAPSLRGNPLNEIPEFQPPDFYHERVCYVGVLTWGLMFTSLLASSPDRWPQGAAAIVLFGLLVSLGRTTVAFEAIGTLLPGLFLFRCPGRCMAIVTLFVALLAGRGFDVLVSQKAVSLRWSKWNVISAVLLLDGVVAYIVDRSIIGFEWSRWVRYATQHLQADLNATALVAICSLSFLLCHRRLPLRLRFLAVMLILVFDLGYFNMRGIRYEVDLANSLPFESQMGNNDQYRFIDAPNYPAISKDLVRYSRYVARSVRSHVRMIGTNEGGMLPFGVEMMFRDLEREPQRTLRLASCRDVVKDTPDGRWLTLSEPLPRIRFVAASNLSQDAVVHVLQDSPQSIAVEVTSPVEGLLFIADSYYPGWRASVDGMPAEISRAERSFRCIQVGAGAHLVQMQFRSDAFVLGCKLSAIGAFALLGLLSIHGFGVWFGSTAMNTNQVVDLGIRGFH